MNPADDLGGASLTARYAAQAEPAAREGAPEDLQAWAQARGLDLAAHVAAIEAEAVRGRTAELEKAHKKWLKQLDKEIAAASERHLRFDDSRPRHLRSECVCGAPGCTRWYDDVGELLSEEAGAGPSGTRSGVLRRKAAPACVLGSSRRAVR